MSKLKRALVKPDEEGIDDLFRELTGKTPKPPKPPEPDTEKKKDQ